MKTFEEEIQELLSRFIEVEAESKDDAYRKVKEMYKNEEIVLDSDDFVEAEIKTFENEQFTR